MMLTDHVYETMLENEEMWIIYRVGCAIMIFDASLFDN